MKHLTQHPLSTQTAKVLGTLALASMTLLAAACGPETESPANVVPDTGADVEPGDPPEGMEPNADATDEPEIDANAPTLVNDDVRETSLAELLGETVTVSTEVTDTLSPNLFTVYDVESFRGEEVLAVTDLPTPAVGDNIEVTGEIMALDVAAIEGDYGITLDPEVVELYDGMPYLAVSAIEAVD